MTDYLQGKMRIDDYVTHERKFAEINDGFHDMHVSNTQSELCFQLTNFLLLSRLVTASDALLTCPEVHCFLLWTLTVQKIQEVYEDASQACISSIIADCITNIHDLRVEAIKMNLKEEKN